MMHDSIQLVPDKKDCCACGACMNICPKNAIGMKEDEYGFLYPRINDNICVKCGLCISVCHYKNPTLMAPKKGYAAANMDIKELGLSASGGVAAAISRSVIECGGVVFGAVIETEKDGMVVYHRAVDSVKDLHLLQGSKYTASQMRYCYKEAKMLLNKGIKVLFTGTPCQINGLYNYLGKPYDNLFTIDIVCHGVASQQMFRDFISFEENKNGGRITNFRFRTKERGWGITASYTIEKGGYKKVVFKHSDELSYCNYFMKGKFDRENCYSCPFAKSNRVGDITVCDFWGIQMSCPELLIVNNGEFDDFRGISGILINTKKGDYLLSNYGNGLRLAEVKTENIIAHNPQLNHPTDINKRDVGLIERYRINGYCEIDSDYQEKCNTFLDKVDRIKRKLLKYIKHMIPLSLKRNIKKLIK